MDVTAFMTGRRSPSSDEPSRSATRAWVRLVRAQQIVFGAIEQDLKQAGLPPLSWYDVLLELTRKEDGRLRPFEIEQRTLLKQYNLSRLLDRLERDDLVRRVPFGDDGRGLWVVITEEGRALQARMWTVYGKSIRAHVGAKLDDESAEQLADLLARLSRGTPPD